MVGCIPEVLTLLLTPILTYIHMVYLRAPYMSNMSYMAYLTYDIHGIWHAYICQYVNFRAKHWNILILNFSFVFFRISFVYFTVLEQSGFAAWDKTKGIFSYQYTIGLRKDRKHKFVWTFFEIWATLICSLI